MSKKALLIIGIILAALVGLYLGMDQSDSHSNAARDAAGDSPPAAGDAAEKADRKGSHANSRSAAMAKRLKVFGRVEFQAGPVSGAEVVLDPAVGDPVFAQTNDQGEFVFEGSFRGVYGLFAEHEGRLSYSMAEDIPMISIARGDQSVGPLVLKLEKGLDLHVRLVSADGGPVRNASLTALGLLERSVKADMSGNAALTLSAGNWVLTARAPYFEQTQMVVDLAGDQSLVMTLKPAGVVSGVVQSADGDPLAGVGITLKGSGSTQTFTTEEDGRYVIEHAPLDRFFAMSFDLTGYAGHSANKLIIPAHKPEMTRDVVLQPLSGNEAVRSRQHGVVVNQTNQPIEGAQIRFGDPGEAGSVEAVSDVAGRFDLELPAYAGRWRELFVQADGYKPMEVKLLHRWQGEDTGLTVVLVAGGDVAGVVYSGDGIPVAGARLVAYWEEFQGKLYNGYQEQVTDENGAFRLRSTTDPVMVHVTAPGFSSTFEKLAYGEDHELVLERRGVIHGRVVMADTGKALNDYRLRVVEDYPIPSESRARMKALAEVGLRFKSSQGSFSVDQLHPGSSYHVVVVHPDGRVHAFRNVTAETADGAEDLILEFGPDSFEIAGRVVDGKGRSMSAVTVELFGFDPRDFSNHSFSWDDWYSGEIYRKAGYYHRIRSDHAGRFRVRGVPSDFRINLMVNEPEHAVTNLQRLQKMDKAELRRLKVVVEQGGAIEVVVNPKTFPNGARIHIQDRDPSAWQVQESWGTDQTRSWFLHVPSGSYRVSASRGRRIMKRFNLEEDVTIGDGVVRTVRLGFEERYDIGGYVSLGNEDYANQTVYLINAEQDIIKERTDSSGHFLMTGVLAGNYWLSAPGGFIGGRRTMLQAILGHPNTVEVELDEDLSRDFYFDPVGSVRCTFSGDVPVTKVAAWSKTENPQLHKGLLIDGVAVVDALPPGTYELVYQDSGPQPVSTQIAFEIPAAGGDIDLGQIHLKPR